VEERVVRTIGIEGSKGSTERSGVNLGAALADSGRSDFNTGGVQNLI
jgi:hypothetical protein